MASAVIKAKLTLDKTAFESGVQKATQMASRAMVGFGIAAAAGIAKSIQAASDLNETVSKTGAIFGQSAKDIEQWASGAAKAFGQSKKQAMDGASTFATFGKSAGLAGKELVGFSTGLTKLASDFASFYNTSPEDAILAIGAALRGENEPIRRYGILLDDATLRQEALRMGLIETTKEALTPQQKVLAANAVIWKQSTDAQGDFARTADDLANSTRTFQAELTNLTAEIGTNFLPLAKEMVGIGKDTLEWLKDTGAIEGFANALRLIPATMAEVTASFYEASAAFKEFLNSPFEGQVDRYAEDIKELEELLKTEKDIEDRALINLQIGTKRQMQKFFGGSADALGIDEDKEKAKLYRQTQQTILNEIDGGGDGMAPGFGFRREGLGEIGEPIPMELGGVGGDGTGSGTNVTKSYESGFDPGGGAFAQGYFGGIGDNLNPSTGFGIGTGVEAPTALDQFEEAGRYIPKPPAAKKGFFGGMDRFAGFKNASGGSALGGPSATSMLGGPNTGGASTGGAYGIVRRGDAARNKAAAAAAEEQKRKEAAANSDPVVQAINRPTWVTEGAK